MDTAGAARCGPRGVQDGIEGVPAASAGGAEIASEHEREVREIKKNCRHEPTVLDDGASDEARTRYLHLGKVALYQMSYTRNGQEAF